MAEGCVTEGTDFVVVVRGGVVVLVIGLGDWVTDFEGREAVCATGVEVMVVGADGVTAKLCVVVLTCAPRASGTADPIFVGSGEGMDVLATGDGAGT